MRKSVIDRVYAALSIAIVLLVAISIGAGALVLRAQAKQRVACDALDASVVVVCYKSIDGITGAYKAVTEPMTFVDAYNAYQLSEADQKAAVVLAKTVYGEARGCSITEQAAVIWCILNRVDRPGAWSDDIVAVATAPYQFVGYRAGNPVNPDLLWLAQDVLTRWRLEQQGWPDVGRVLPKEYVYFNGDGRHNHFRTEYRGGQHWDWSAVSPYDWEGKA